MQSKNAIAIVHVMAGMHSVHKLYAHCSEHRRWTHVQVMIQHFKSINAMSSQLCIFLDTTLYHRVGIIESVDSISRDEPDSPLTQYITNAGISRARYTITH